MRTTKQQQMVGIDQIQIADSYTEQLEPASKLHSHRAEDVDVEIEDQREEYVDEFLGSYKDLQIPEDNEEVDYYEDDYEEVEEAEELELEKVRLPNVETVPGGGQHGEESRESGAATGTLSAIDQKISELKGQVKRRKIDFDDESTIPDMRATRQLQR